MGSARLHQELVDPVGGVAAVAARGPHRWQPTLAGPVGHCPFAHLEKESHLTGTQQATFEGLPLGVIAEELSYQRLALALFY